MSVQCITASSSVKNKSLSSSLYLSLYPTHTHILLLQHLQHKQNVQFICIQKILHKAFDMHFTSLSLSRSIPLAVPSFTAINFQLRWGWRKIQGWKLEVWFKMQTGPGFLLDVLWHLCVSHLLHGRIGACNRILPAEEVNYISFFLSHFLTPSVKKKKHRVSNSNTLTSMVRWHWIPS